LVVGTQTKTPRAKREASSELRIGAAGIAITARAAGLGPSGPDRQSIVVIGGGHRGAGSTVLGTHGSTLRFSPAFGNRF
jgi:hypothetical protein